MRQGNCIGLGVAAALLLAAPALAATAPPPAQAEGPIGYGGAMVQLNPMMSPYRTPSGIRYQVVTLRLVLDVGVNERPACFMAPVVHEKIMFYLYKTMPQPADLVGQRRDVLEKALLDLATATTDRGFYSAVRVVDEESPPLMSDPKSQTLSTQCK
jgi:hypothetical protein